MALRTKRFPMPLGLNTLQVPQGFQVLMLRVYSRSAYFWVVGDDAAPMVATDFFLMRKRNNETSLGSEDLTGRTFRASAEHGPEDFFLFTQP